MATINKINLFGEEFDIEGSTPSPNVLWDGAYYMGGDQSVSLDALISSQPTGIVLVFTTYDSSAGIPLDTNFSSFFVPKNLVANHEGTASTFQMNTVMFGTIATKKLYISDDSITGDDNNTSKGTANGITYNNAHYVLRYVIGV